MGTICRCGAPPLTLRQCSAKPDSASGTIGPSLVTLRKPSNDVNDQATNFPHIAALDGIRGIAVAAVLVFHGGFAVASGGFLGVSTFFTLSGFLIASLLLTERATSDTVDLKTFWIRRFRRLMPAAVVTLGLIAAVSWTVPSVGRNDSLGGDLWAGLLYVANWRFILSGLSYNDLFAEESPVQHFWSLAVEEQFYVIFPLLAAVLLAVGGRSRSLFAWVVGALLAVSVTLPFVYDDADRIYNGTDVRMAEILLGVLLAVVYGNLSARETVRTSQIVKVLGVLALAGSVTIWIVTEQTDAWLYNGGFAAYALLSVFIIAAATQQSGPVPRLLAWRPLVYLGVISYGVYLYHWPIFLWFDQDSTGLDGLPLFGLRLAITFTVAWLSFHYLETPIRRGVMPGANLDQRWIPAAAATIVVIMGVLFLSPLLEDDAPEFEFAETPSAESVTSDDVGSAGTETPPESPVDVGADGGSAEATTTPTPFTRSESPTLVVMGDSVAENLMAGLERRAAATGDDPPIQGDLVFAGCGIAKAPEGSLNLWGDDPAAVCRTEYDHVAAALEIHRPDVVVLPVGPPDLLPKRYPEDDDFITAEDPLHLSRLTDAYRELQETVLESGAAVLWVNMPCMSDERLQLTAVGPAEVVRVNEAIAAVAAASPAAAVYDLHSEVCPTGSFLVSYEANGTVDDEARADGVHFSDFAADAIAEQIAAAALLVPPPKSP